MKNLFKNKKAAMEMSVGTIVTIVLLMAVLVLGLVLTRTIFKGSEQNINSIDEGVKNQINELFSKDDLKKIVLYPGTSISIKKGGDESGFAFSIRNIETAAAVFSYKITADSIERGCSLSNSVAESYISLGSSGSGIQIPAGNKLENPIFVKFRIPEDAPPCEIRYKINVYKGSSLYDSVYVDVKIISK
jgi:hypothetical protein